ncbi:MAG: sensor histidine kinase [Betaproteobacteria bacterium]|nr:sensor histidine kinase [Betaproteobacteria bacterium]
MNSLRLRLLLWVMVPMSAVLALTAWVSWRDAGAQAQTVEDARLLASARMIAGQVGWSEGVLVASTPPAALDLFASRQRDRVYFQVRERGGALLAGWPDLPATDAAPDGAPRFRQAGFRGAELRMVSLEREMDDAQGRPRRVLVSVAETRGAFDALRLALWRPALLHASLLLALALALMLLGLTLELRPLLRLRAQLLRRADDDLSPLRAGELQRELRPVVETINQQAARLSRQIDVQKRFVADAAHQLRTPLALIHVQLHDAASQAGSSALQATLDALRQGTRQLGRVVEQLLSLSQAESRHAAMPPRVGLDLADSVREVMLELAMLAEARGIDLGLDPVPEALPRVLADAALLHALVYNLVDNALRYTPAGGSVSLRLELRGPRVELSVCDTGPGIAPELRARVFERFYRIEPAPGGGSGLGLAIVREAAAACAAGVRLESAPAGGLCARVDFEPAAASRLTGT